MIGTTPSPIKRLVHFGLLTRRRNPRDRQYSATVVALIGIGPKDEIEGMIAAQLIAAHNAAMECYWRAMIGEQKFEGRRENSATPTSSPAPTRCCSTRSTSTAVVEHVHVHAGGQAVVGTTSEANHEEFHEGAVLS
jgi:hypothetical protein